METVKRKKGKKREEKRDLLNTDPTSLKPSLLRFITALSFLQAVFNQSDTFDSIRIHFWAPFHETCYQSFH